MDKGGRDRRMEGSRDRGREGGNRLKCVLFVTLVGGISHHMQ